MPSPFCLRLSSRTPTFISLKPAIILDQSLWFTLVAGAVARDLLVICLDLLIIVYYLPSNARKSEQIRPLKDTKIDLFTLMKKVLKR